MFEKEYAKNRNECDQDCNTKKLLNASCQIETNIIYT